MNSQLHLARQKASISISKKADQFALGVAPVIMRCLQEGLTTPYSIAIALDALNVPTSRGGKWSRVVVGDILARLARDVGAIPGNPGPGGQ